MVQYCVVPQCKSKYVVGNAQKLKFHSFPKTHELMKKWLVNLRSAKKAQPWQRVCSLHFRDSDYTITSQGEFKILNTSAVPTQNLPKRSTDLSPKKRHTAREDRLKKRTVQEVTIAQNEAETDQDENEVSPDSVQVQPINILPSNVDPPVIPATQSVSTQTFMTNRIYQFIAYQLLTEKEVLYFCGFESKRFDCLHNFLVAPRPIVPVCTCSTKDQLLMTLCKYKHNLDYTMLAFLFRIPPRTVTKIFSYWTDLIFNSLRSVDFWSLGNQDPDKYRCIIDCTEIPILKNENPAYHQLTYSQYKNRTTFKSLVGIDESGKIIFCSDIYGGSTSDRQIVTLSNFASLPEEGTTILADRGFEISDLLEARNVALNIPPFLRGKKQLTESEVMETRKIANRRIHVERLIGLSKINKIMREPMPSHLWPMANQINYNCTMLCNMKPPFLKSIPRKYQKKYWLSYVEMCNNKTEGDGSL